MKEGTYADLNEESKSTDIKFQAFEKNFILLNHKCMKVGLFMWFIYVQNNS